MHPYRRLLRTEGKEISQLTKLLPWSGRSPCLAQLDIAYLDQPLYSDLTVLWKHQLLQLRGFADIWMRLCLRLMLENESQHLLHAQQPHFCIQPSLVMRPKPLHRPLR